LNSFKANEFLDEVPALLQKERIDSENISNHTF